MYQEFNNILLLFFLMSIYVFFMLYFSYDIRFMLVTTKEVFYKSMFTKLWSWKEMLKRHGAHSQHVSNVGHI